MKQINIAKDIVPVAEFKVQVSKYLKNIKTTGRPMVITQNGKPAGVLLTPDDFEELIYQKSLIESISRGISDIEKGNVFTTEELRAELEKRRV
ncbi:MAG: type II toxin-antitoxin system Phd/YefM family antitoxin [Proteobacteria bacterium]|nr:type II toxin-antitoxin system Phd/YefM family antitoxin [Pseudomonadota bacterium]MBU4010795.1 type II toxin-antitoxin system Phd/YefM family antitoxin [Pseudomonadota bacterium]MBU4037557.1 type II toxin-antitoxin system Phd/YefM family antitoxin [Pseudomonadota bacterium]